jgi:hypothetical protein
VDATQWAWITAFRDVSKSGSVTNPGLWKAWAKRRLVSV